MKKLSILILSILYTCNLFPQTSSDSIPVLPSDEVEVVKSFEAITKTATAVFPPPGSEEEMETGSISSFNYSVQAQQVDIKDELPNLRPLAYTTPVEIEKYDGFIDVSFANPKSPKVDYGYNYNIEDWFEIGLTGNFFTSDDEKIAFRDHTDYGNRLYGKYHFNENVSSGLNLSYNFAKRYFYGTAVNTEVLQEELSRSLFGFEASGNVEFNFIKESGTRLVLGGNYRNTNLGKFGQHEHRTMSTGLIQKTFSDQHMFEVKSDLRYYVTDPDLSPSAKQFVGNVKSKFHYNTFHRLKAGVGVDAIKSFDSWVFQPNITIRYSVHDRVHILGGAQSVTDIYDTQSLFDANPFVTFDNANVHTHNAIRPYLGVYYIDNLHSLKVKALYNRERGIPLFGYRHIEDIPMYSILALDANYYSTATDYALELKNTKLSAGGEFRFTDQVNLSNWRTYMKLEHALLNNKVDIFLNAELLDSRIIQKVEVIRLAPRSDRIYDLTLGTRLHVNSIFGINASIINLLGKEYQDWFAYPVYGRQYRVGAFVKF